MLVVSLAQSWMRRRRARRTTSASSVWHGQLRYVRLVLETLEDRTPLGNFLGPAGLDPTSFLGMGNNGGNGLTVAGSSSGLSGWSSSSPTSLPGGTTSSATTNGPASITPAKSSSQPAAGFVGSSYGASLANLAGENGGTIGTGGGGGSAGSGGSGGTGVGGGSGGGGVTSSGSSILQNWAPPLNPMVVLSTGTDNLSQDMTLGAAAATAGVGSQTGTGQGSTGSSTAAKLNVPLPNLLHNQATTSSTSTATQVSTGTGASGTGAVYTILGSQLLGTLSQGYAQALKQGNGTAFLQQQGQYFVVSGSNVLVNLRFPSKTNYSQMQTTLANQFGMHVTGVTQSQGLITGYVPITNLALLNSAPTAIGASPVYAPQFSAGPVVDQGAAVVGAPSFIARTGANGSGETVGVISDSVNQVSTTVDGATGTSLSVAQKLGALPSNVNVLGDSTVRPTDEGAGMLELVHQVAPGANLSFDTAEGGPQAMAQSINALASSGANVIVDDAQYPDEPFFNDGVLAQAVDNTVIDHNVVYVTSAGNNGNNGWQGSWRPAQATVGGVNGTFQSFNAATGQTSQTFQLAVGQTLNLSFQWDSAFLEGGSNQAQYQVPNNMAVLITTGDGKQLLERFSDVNSMTGEALQRVVFTNNGSFGTTSFAMSFQLVSGPAPTELKWIRFDSGNPAAAYQGAPTIFGHAAALQAVTVGAVAYNNTHSPEPYSSQGKVSIYFDENGKRLAAPIQRYKPDVAGPDQVNSTTFGAPSTGQFPGAWAGTSAAAANLAGNAALLRSQTPSNNYWATVLKMEQGAVPVESSSWSPVTGYGLDPLPPTGGPPIIPLNTSSWTLIGPAPVSKTINLPGDGPTSGRLVGVAPDPTNPNIIYIAAAGGGVWKTTDGGTTWAPLTDGQATLFMGAIAVAPSNANVIYAGTGESNNSGDSSPGKACSCRRMAARPGRCKTMAAPLS